MNLPTLWIPIGHFRQSQRMISYSYRYLHDKDNWFFMMQSVARLQFQK